MNLIPCKNDGLSSNYSRRKFINHAGIGILAATAINQLTTASSFAQNTPKKTTIDPGDLTPVKLNLPALDNPSEVKRPEFFTPLNPDQRVGYAIVGLGHLSLEEILPAFGQSKFAKPVALVSGDPEKAKKVAKQYGIDLKNLYNYQNFDSIKDNPAIQAVYIVLPNGLHEEFTIRAAKAGKHVLCEKPMAVNSKQAENMIAACKKAGKKLMIAYRIQYEPHNRFAQKLTREKTYGQIKVIEAVNGQNIGDPAQWRLKKALAGGGALPDIGLYCLNTVRFLLGEEPDQVLATTYSTPNDPRFKEVEEAVFFQLRFPSGTIANCTTSYGIHQSRRYRCYGNKGGWFGLDPAFAYQLLKFEGSKVVDDHEENFNPSLPEKQQFALEMDHFAKCIIDNTIPYTPGEEGLQDHIIMEAIYESAKTGKPIKLKSINQLDSFRGSFTKLD